MKYIPTADQETFAWLTARGAEVATLLASAHPAARRFGDELLTELLLYREKLTPGASAHYAQARAKRAQQRSERMNTEGPKLWEELHRHARAQTKPEADEENRWLDAFGTRLPCGECRKFFTAYRGENPIGKDYFGWSVALHNAVNAKLGKAPVTRQQAAALWE